MNRKPWIVGQTLGVVGLCWKFHDAGLLTPAEFQLIQSLMTTVRERLDREWPKDNAVSCGHCESKPDGQD